MNSKADVEEQIRVYANKLEQIKGVDSNDSKRIKKRIFQKLGKLKNKLKLAESNTIDEKASTLERSDFNGHENDPISQFTPSQAKMKIKLLHKELAQYAQKKQLNLALKKFQWAIRKGLPVNIHTYANILNAYVRCGDMEGNFL